MAEATNKIYLKEWNVYMIGAPRKYFTDRERSNALRQQKNNYSNKKFYKCEECACTVNLGNKPRHLKSIKHNKSCN